MIPSRGVVQSLSSAGRRVQISSQLVTKGFATRQSGNNGRSLSTVIRAPTGGASPLRRIRGRLPAGALATGGIPASSRNLSLWSWGGSKKPAEQLSPAPAETSTLTPEPAAASTPAIEPIAPAKPEAAVSPDLFSASSDPSSILPLDLDPYGSISAIPERIGYLSELGLDFGWGPTSTMQWLLEHVHVYSGLPWWGSILATSLLLRLAMLKPLVVAQENSSKLSVLKQTEPGYDAAMKDVMAAAANQDQVAMQVAKRLAKQYEVKHGVQKWKVALAFVQIPIGFAMFRLLRGMTHIPVPGLETGGLLWFTNLAVPDPYYILTAMGPIAMVTSMAISNRYSTPAQQASMKVMAAIFIPVGVMFSMWLPAAIQFYFACLSIPGVLQTWILFRPAVRKRLGLSPLPDPKTLAAASPASKNPFKNFKQSIQDAQKGFTERRAVKSQASAAERRVHDEAALQEKYWETLRDRMAEQERMKKMNKRP